MRLELRLGGLISLNGHEIALGQTVELLDALAETRSVRGAAERLELSYRATWGRIETLEAAFSRPLVVKTRGHGSVLTDAGATLRAMLGGVLGEFQGSLGTAERSLTRTLAAFVEGPPRRLTLTMSDDPLLTDVVGTLPNIDVTIAGSAEAAGKLLAGAIDAAGLHFDGAVAADASLFARLLADPAFAVEPLFNREQGLLVAPGNPLCIASIADLARRRARFVNRQRASGTRMWFDRLLREAGVDPAAIAGYDIAEFTHQAVAAVVASGAADAGMGVRAAAERFGLDFIPLAEETYSLGVRASLADDARIKAIRDRAKARAAGMLGYKPARKIEAGRR